MVDIKNQVLSKFNDYKNEYKSNAHKKFKIKYPNISNWLLNKFQTKSLTEAIYRYSVNNPVCPITNEKTEFLEWGKIKTYSKNADKELVKKHKIEKLKEVAKNKDYTEIVKKVKKTKLVKYGNENYNNIDKNKKTKLVKYGNENYNNRDKFVETMSGNWDKRNTKSKITNMNKYGVEYPLQNKDIFENMKQTNRKKYGTDYPMQSIKVRNKVVESQKTSYYNNVLLCNDFLIPKFTLSEYIKSNELGRPYWDFKCKKCGSDVSMIIGSTITKETACTGCNPRKRSKVQNEIVDFIKTIYSGKIETDQKKYITPQELDIVLPEIKLAIELDGVFYHTEIRGNKNSKYHLDKTEKCKSIGLDLLHIFDNEWYNKTDIVKSIIKNRIVGSDNKINGRDTEVIEITSKKSNSFLQNNHIQGTDNSAIHIGLKYNNEIVSVMTFGKSRYGKDTEYEMYRYCNKLNTMVRGGANKLFKYFLKTYKPKSVKTFSDRRYFNGNVYKSIGFTFKEYTKPNYFYTKNFTQLESRQKYQKHKLKNIFENYNPTKTEFENMVSNGYDRIWDCGNIKFIWTQ